jgi:hypothetical protein
MHLYSYNLLFLNKQFLMKQFSLIVIVFLLLFSIPATGQYYNTGQDPASLKWMQIRTPRFSVIYPKSYGDQGVNFAKALDKAYSDLITLYPPLKFRIPVIIHSYTTLSNGYVAWAPSRMEIYPTPEQNTIPLDADRQLALHELTHVFQMESINQGFTRALSFVAGQQVTGVVSSLLPFWFLEGDAVFSESFFTGSGRGRTPSFQKELKAIMVEKGGIYRYDKILNGSFRDFVPDYYESGYQIVAWADSKYGHELWGKTLSTVAREPFLLNPVNLSLRKNASLTKKRLFNEAFDSLGTIWKSNDISSGSKSYNKMNPPKNGKFINYYSPVVAGRDSIIAVRTSLTDIPCFVLIRPSQNSEKRMYYPGYGDPWFITFSKGKLVWVETHNDPRWDNRSWSVINTLDIKNNTPVQLSFGTRYMSASISPDGKLIAATENGIDNSNSIVLLDAGTGYIIDKVPSPGNVYLQKPQWDQESRRITVIFLAEQGEGIMSFRVSDRNWETLVEAGNNDIQSSCLSNDSLFFVSSASGTDNVFMRAPDGSVRNMTRSRFGISDLIINGGRLVFADYTSSGNDICTCIISEAENNSAAPDDSRSYLINRFKPAKKGQEAESDKAYTPVPYNRLGHLFRFHSWMPFYADLEKIQSDPASVSPGVTLMTQNDLSTLISTFSYEYSGNRHKFHSGIKWLGWYPELESRLDYGNSPVIEKFMQSVSDPSNLKRGYSFTNTISLPMFFRGGRFFRYLYISASSALENNYLFLKEKDYYDTQQNQLTGRIYFSNYQRSAIRDIYPEWAQSIDLSYSFYPSDKAIYGDILTGKSSFYFPGIFRNQGIRLRIEAEKQNPQKYILDNRASISRGYSNIISKDLRFLSADYFLPVGYPDFNLGPILYITRIRTDLFYDFTRATGNYVLENGSAGKEMNFHDYSENFRSYGIELMSDFYVLRIPFMMSGGVQAAWTSPGEAPVIRLLFNIDLLGMSIGGNRR